MLENQDGHITTMVWKKGFLGSIIFVIFLVCGSKLIFENKTTNLEILIICAFATTFALAACTVTICRFPKNSNATNNVRNVRHQHHPASNNNSHSSQPHNRNTISASTVNATTAINEINLSTSQQPQFLCNATLVGTS